MRPLGFSIRIHHFSWGRLWAPQVCIVTGHVICRRWSCPSSAFGLHWLLAQEPTDKEGRELERERRSNFRVKNSEHEDGWLREQGVR